MISVQMCGKDYFTLAPSWLTTCFFIRAIRFCIPPAVLYENDVFASLPDETLLDSLDGYAETGALCFPAIYDLTNPSSAKRLVRALSASSRQKVPSVQNDSVPVSKEEALNILRKLKK